MQFRAIFLMVVTLLFNVFAAAYTVDPPTDAPGDTIEDCTSWAVAEDADTCDTLAGYGSISVDQLYSYNPSLTNDCEIDIGISYCVEQNFAVPPPTTTTSFLATTTTPGNGITTPTPTQTGMINSCNQFHKVVSGDTCSDISSKSGVGLDDFYEWNPAVGDTCASLLSEYYVCVGIIGQTPTLPPTSTTPTNGITTPTPTQTGMTGNCNKFHKVMSGDTCSDLATTYKVSLDNFYSWNPAVGSDCTKLGLYYYVCVGIIGGTTVAPSPTTTKPGNGISTPTPIQEGMASNCDRFYKVQTGDGCYDIAADAVISLDNFYKWNTGVGNNCQTLFPSYYVCIHVVGTPTKTTTKGNGIVTPTPTQTGMVKTCDTFHKVVSGDQCADIAADAGVTLAKFYSWNPAVGSTCKSLFLGYYVCIGLI